MLLSAQQLQQVSSAISGLNPAQLAWLGGYIAGLSGALPLEASNLPNAAVAPAPLTNALKTTILYGSQTGNSKKVAEQLYKRLQAQGAEVSLVNLKDYRPQQLKKEQRLIAVVSTHGNGEPPDDARAFFSFISGERAPKLPDLEYAVLALGDSSYEEFCQTGAILDARLAELGAKRLLARVDCDVDFAASATAWQQQVLDKTPKPSSNIIQFHPHATANAVAQALEYSAENPYRAELLQTLQLTDTGSSKDVLHLEFSLEGFGISYQPGDILAVAIENEAQLVHEVLRLLKLEASERVTLNGNATDLLTALTQHRELSSITRRQLKQYAQLIQHPELSAAADDKEALCDWLYAADWVDVLHEFPGQLSAQALVDLLRPLQPRQYSIASSPTAHADEVHLLVKRVEYTFNGRTHLGTASNGLARLAAGDSASVYLKPNPHFKLPQDAKTKIIMIGAGTGVAPFRSFLFEREAQGLQANTWLFFGEQRFRTDFLYQSEWQQLLANGTLEKMSVAFSRDQVGKVYVQHRLLEAGAEVYQWLQQGAHLYVCGDMHGMAKDVHQALIEIVCNHSGQTAAQASAWLEQLIAEHRYQRDVY